MNELDLIHRLTASLPTNPSVIVGSGDDCAVLESPGLDTQLLLKTDAIVEGVHFTTSADPEQIGHKALGRCLSDIAAMAGIPLHAVITLGLPADFDDQFIQRIYDGLNSLARRFQVAVVGGETVRNPDRIFLSIALLGKVPKGRWIGRKGARPGDALFVTGDLGGSILGKHLDFEPRLNEAHWLAQHFNVHAMIDLSDGLASDLRHLLHAGSLGAELLGAAIPISRAARLQAKDSPSAKSPLLAALTDGEDFELLFAVASSDAVPLLDAWKQEFPRLSLSCIGKVSNQPEFIIRTKEGMLPLPQHGFIHFT